MSTTPEYDPLKDPERPKVGTFIHNPDLQKGEVGDYEIRRVDHHYLSEVKAGFEPQVGGYDLALLVPHASRPLSYWAVYASKKGWEIRIPHPRLDNDHYYESGSVKRGRSDKTCEHCGKSIPIGVPHTTHKFYGEDGDYPTYPTHYECDELFEESLLKDGEFSDYELEKSDPAALKERQALREKYGRFSDY